MKIVIDIPDNVFKRLVAGEIQYGGITARNIFNSVKNGIPLPKGHGRLIDADALLKHSDGGDWNGVCCDPEYVKTRYIHSAPTIIEADKGEEECQRKTN